MLRRRFPEELKGRVPFGHRIAGHRCDISELLFHFFKRFLSHRVPSQDVIGVSPKL